MPDGCPSPGALRQRRHAARRRAGLVRLAITVPDIETTELLTRAGVLPEAEQDDHQAMARAIEALLQTLGEVG